MEGKEGENLVESAIRESTCLDQRVIAFQHFLESMTAGTSTVKPYTNFDLSRVGPIINTGNACQLVLPLQKNSVFYQWIVNHPVHNECFH